MGFKPRRYIVLTDPDTLREGEVRLGGEMDDYWGHWTGGQLIFKWSTNQVPKNLCAPERVHRIVDLANKALDDGKK